MSDSGKKDLGRETPNVVEQVAPETGDITREGIKVEAGQIWRDLDKRMNGREVCVMKVYRGFAFCVGTNNRRVRIAIGRMHKHNTGFELVGSPVHETSQTST